MDDPNHPPGGFSGRGALRNPRPRFLDRGVERAEDGWYREEVPHSIATQVRPEPARSIISHNDSPDIPFEQSINPYRGCEHGCPYCVGPETPILMDDGSTRPIAALRVGDSIYGTTRDGWYRRYVTTQVMAHWSVIKPAYRITLEDGTELIAGGDHRFLTERGWKHVTGTEQGPLCRPHLTINNKLMGVGQFAKAPEHDEDYRRGYLCAMIRGDGSIGRDFRGSDGIGRVHQYFRLALCDDEALRRAEAWLLQADVRTRRFQFCAGSDTRRPMQAIAATGQRRVDLIRDLTCWPRPAFRTRSWSVGFLAGIFDAEGSYSEGILRISNTDPQIIDRIGDCLKALTFRFVIEHIPRETIRSIDVVRVVGGLREHLRFFHTVDPAIFYKADAARLLEEELGKRSYVVKPIAIGANTDPYQPVERDLRVTRSLLEVLERTRHPVSLITKGSLILRDLDLLQSLSRDGLINVFVSVTSLDAELKRTLEPRTASPAARLRVVRELAAAGVPTGVLVAPIIPAVNDSELERIVAAAAEAGAFRAGYVLLRLPHELKQLFRQWLDEHMPDRAEHVMSLIRGARDGQENDPRFGSRMRGSGAWAQLLHDRFALACKRHGLSVGRMRELSCAHFKPPLRGGQMTLGI